MIVPSTQSFSDSQSSYPPNQYLNVPDIDTFLDSINTDFVWNMYFNQTR